MVFAPLLYMYTSRCPMYDSLSLQHSYLLQSSNSTKDGSTNDAHRPDISASIRRLLEGSRLPITSAIVPNEEYA